jgi:diketogulonate reductase-like aldo/keto reductase/putative intracellular protease/amidase
MTGLGTLAGRQAFGWRSSQLHTASSRTPARRFRSHPVDPKSEEPQNQTPASIRFKLDSAAQAAMAHRAKLSPVVARDYDAVFHPGGHGPLWDLAEDPQSIALIETIYAAGKPVVAVCQAPGVVRHTRTPDGAPLVKGNSVTGFSNTEEEAIGLTHVVPFPVEDSLVANGGDYSQTWNWEPCVVIHGCLITGQNPSSSEPSAHVHDGTGGLRARSRRKGMQRRRFGFTNYTVLVIGQGTWNIEGAGNRSAVAALRRGLELGMNHIDTAEMYGNGEAEAIVAEAIAGRRHGAFVVTKVLPQNATRAGTLLACERSLSKLRTDYIDCYLLHWRGPHPLEETVAAFEILQREGKILSWGVSNFDVRDLEDLRAIDKGVTCACDQVLYSLLERTIEHAVLPWCERYGVAVTAYSPLGHGTFPGPRTPEGRVLADVAEVHGATPRQVALSFLTRRPSVFGIPKASNPRHAEENAGAGDLRLSDVEIDRIDRMFPKGPIPDRFTGDLREKERHTITVDCGQGTSTVLEAE